MSSLPPVDPFEPEKPSPEGVPPRRTYTPLFWFFVVGITLMLGWGVASWYSQRMTEKQQNSPFQQVTNRQFSLFLWQFPQYMRVNATNKNNYLPGFQYQNKISLDLNQANAYVSAPPELIFLYHTWNRLIAKEFTQRPIPPNEFLDFLDYAPEWKAQNWTGAPEGYLAFLGTFLPRGRSDITDLNKLPATSLPLEVRQAFQGW